jgi:cadmium resistance protein CadD (predicted permease)
MAPDLDGADEPGVAVPEPAEAPVLGTDPEQAPAQPVARGRVLALAALGPLLTGYTAVAALLALVAATATNSHFTTTGVLLAALPGWLAAHQVPLSVLGLELGVLPLLPTIGVAAVTATTASVAAARLRLHRPGQAGQVIGTIAVAHGVAGMAIAGFATGDVTADAMAALYHPALVSGLAATAGVARRCGLVAAVVERADAVAVAGLRTGALAVVLLLAAGGALLTFGLATSVPQARVLFPTAVGDAVGMLLLSVGYLPNAVVAATAFVAGPGFSLGDVAMSPLEYAGGPVPAVPLLAALPERQEAWWPALFVLPLVVGVVVGRRLRAVDEDPVARLRGVVVASGVVAVSFVVLAGSAGGGLGRGPFDPVSVEAVAVSVTLVLWTAVPGAVTAWFGGPRRPAEYLPGLLDEPEDDPDDEPEDADPHDVEPRDAAEEPAAAADDTPAETAPEEDESAEPEPARD